MNLYKSISQWLADKNSDRFAHMSSAEDGKRAINAVDYLSTCLGVLKKRVRNRFTESRFELQFQCIYSFNAQDHIDRPFLGDLNTHPERLAVYDDGGELDA